MSSLMGGQADATEDMFAKLESMRAVITEVNTQFKDPVCVFIHQIRYLVTDSQFDRKKQRLFACASLSSYLCMRPNV